jgi:hypothetical protein
MGRFILYLGLIALAVIGGAALAVGESMSTAEMQVGLLPAAVVAFVGLVLAVVGSSRPFERGAPPPETGMDVSADRLDLAGLVQAPPAANQDH